MGVRVMSVWSRISGRVHDDHAWIASRLSVPNRDETIKVNPELQLIIEGYVRHDRSGYAVLVSGEWGAGKTTQVLECLKTIKPSVPFVHVSLYGLSTENDIKSAIVASIGPEKHKTAQAMKGLEKTLSGVPIIKGLTDGVISSVYVSKIIESINLSTVFVFDDLERFSSKHMDVALGFINKLIEREGRRVIVLAHEDKIVDEINGKREKIFGRHVKIEPEVDSALHKFINDIDTTDVIRDILNRNKSKIADLFRLSEINSLRVLHHTLNDLSRLLSYFDAETLDLTDIIDPVITTVIVFELEFRAERISEKDIENYAESWISQVLKTSKDDNDNRAQNLKKYFGLRLQDSALSLSTVARVVARGAFDATKIKGEMSDHIAARRRQKTPPWRIVSDLDKRETHEIEQAIEEMERMLIHRDITDIGDILHTCSMMMLMASIGHSMETVQSTLSRFQRYVDDLCEHGELAAAPLGAHVGREYKDAAHGYGYWVTPDYSDEFSDFHAYLDKKRDETLTANLMTKAKELLEDLRGNAKIFVGKLVQSDQETTYGTTPILSYIDVFDFWRAFLSVPKRDWERIQAAIAQRIDHSLGNGPLASERKWFQDLRLLLDQEINASSGLDRYRLQRFLKFGQFDKLARDVSVVRREEDPPAPE
jgi:hypothetical protein